VLAGITVALCDITAARRHLDNAQHALPRDDPAATAWRQRRYRQARQYTATATALLKTVHTVLGDPQQPVTNPRSTTAPLPGGHPPAHRLRPDKPGVFMPGSVPQFGGQSMMDDSMLTAVAAAVSSRTVEAISDATRAGLARLMRLVGNKLGHEPASAAVLAAAQAEPSNTERVDALRADLQRAVASDAQFAAELTRQWRRVQLASHASGGGVVNTITGTVSGPTVQARDIRGGVSFGADPANRPEANQ
jgi:hypothetical protein